MCALVRGMTDILTPVNLLPNSDFSRIYISSPLTFSSISKTLNLHYAGYGYYLYMYSGASNLPVNVIVTKTTSGLNIKGTFNTATNYDVLRLTSVMKLVGGKTYSNSAVITKLVNCTASVDINGNHTTSYNKNAESANENCNSVMTPTVDNANVSISIHPNVGSNVDFEITIQEAAVYEGSFVNPPISTSLDVKPSNQFALSTDTELWYNDTDCAGFRMNFNQSSTANGVRLGACAQVPVGQTGDYFNNMIVYSRMKRCNVADNGTVNAYYGDASYKEDGSNGQVMVEIPLFYYRVIPTKTKKSNRGWGGTAIIEAEWWLSDSCKEGFKIHPLFIGPNGEIKEKAYIGAFEASTYDVSASAYNTTDAQTVDWTNDKLASIAGAKPTSGSSQTGATRAGFRKIASNRGTKWHIMDVFEVSAIQLLMAVEYGSFDSQASVGRGVVDMVNGQSTYSNTAVTGSTVGNTSGNATSTKVWSNNTLTTQTVNGKVSVSYRGIENAWGNIWGFYDGLNVKNRIAYISKIDRSTVYEDDTIIGYQHLKYELPSASSYVRYLGYDPDYDFVFLPAQVNSTTEPATENGPVSDYCWQSSVGSISCIGGAWYQAGQSGLFNFAFDSIKTSSIRNCGSRLSYSIT